MAQGGLEQKSPLKQSERANELAEQILPGRQPNNPIASAARYQTVVDERSAAADSIKHRLSVWRKASGQAASGSASIPNATGSLDGVTRGRMESALGTQLGDVKVGTGGESAEAASQLGARAFAVGNQVHFGAGQFSPGSKEGDRLLAHELTHVVQGRNSGVQRSEDPGAHDAAGGAHDHEGHDHEVSKPDDPAEHEADKLADHATAKLHGGAVAGAAPKATQAAPATAAKLMRKIYLGGRQAKPKPQKPLPQVDPAVRQEMDAIKAYIEKEAQKAKTLWSAAAIPVGTVLVAAGKGAAVGTGAGPVGTAVGAAAGAVVGALISIFGIGHTKHKIMEEKAKLLDNVDLLVHQPDIIHELCDYCSALAPDLKTLEAKIGAAVEELSNRKKKLAQRDKKTQDSKKPKTPPAPPSTAHKVEHGAHKAHEGAEIAEAGLETAAAGTEAGAHVVGEGAAHVLEAVTPALEGAAHVAQGAGALVGAVVAGLDYKTFRDKSKKFEELKSKLGS